MRLDFLRCRSGVFTELRDFFLVEESPVAGGDFAGKDGADADSDEAFDFVAHFIKHEADLALEPLPEGHADLLASDGVDDFAFGKAGFDAEAAQEFFPVGDVEGLVEADFVFFFDLVAG